MKLSLLALIAPAVAFALLFAACTAHADPQADAAHAAALIRAPLTHCTPHALATGGTVLVCSVGVK